MSLMIGLSTALGAGLAYTASKIAHLKKRQRVLLDDLERQSIYSEIYPIKRVLRRYHKLMEPQEFIDVAHQQARFRGIQGAIQSANRLKALIESEWVEALDKTNILHLLNYHRDFLEELEDHNNDAKEILREIPVISERPPCPQDLERKKQTLRRALDEYDHCLYKFNVEKCLAEMREVMEVLRFHAPEVLVKPEVWEALIRNEHFLIELVNLLPEKCQKGLRTDAAMFESVG